MQAVLILLALSFVIFASPYISALIKVPISATEIILGILLGTLGFLPPNELFKDVADIGFYYLMFLAGTEVDLKIFINAKKGVLKNSTLFLGLLYIFSIIAVYTFGLSELFIVIIPVMSVGILSILYKEYGKNENWLNLAMLVGVIGEVLSIAILTLLNAYTKYGLDIKLFVNLGALAGFLIVTTLIFRWLDVLFWWYPNLKKIIMPQFDKNEKDIRFSIAMLCLVIAVVVILDIKIIIGAFIAGTFIPTFFSHKKDLPEKLSSFGYGFLVPIFFAYIGSTVNLNALLIPGVVKNVIFLTILMIVVRLLSSVVMVKNIGLKQSFLFGISLSIPLTLLIATATIGHETNYISDEIYYALVLTSIFEAIVGITLIKIIKNIYLNKKWFFNENLGIIYED